MRRMDLSRDLALWREVVTRAAARGIEIDTTTNAERKATVMQHPDLAARLCDRPMGYERPDQWTGYIAPATTEIGEGYLAKRNDSPYRAQVVAIYEEALAREEGRS